MVRPVPIALALLFTSAPALAQHSSVGLRKGPWLMDPRATEITVMAEREGPGPLDITVELDTADGEGGAPVVLHRPAALLHEHTITGLLPATRYRYALSSADGVRASGRFVTAPEGDAFVPFRFAIYGDTRSRAARHRAVANAIASDGADWAIHTGDFVDDGREDEQWTRFFELERDLLASTPMIPVIGNHEIARPGSDGIDLYRRYVHCAPSAESPQPELHYSFSWGNVQLVLVNAYDDFTDPATAQWLRTRLQSARARADATGGWVLFVSHWGPRSSGPHGESRPFRMGSVSDWLRQYRVDVCIAGHDHLYERGDDAGLRYIVTGGGGSPLYQRRFDRDYARRVVSEHHFVRVDVERDRLVFAAVRPDGTTIERCGLLRTGWDCDRGPGVGGRAPASSEGIISAARSAVESQVQRNCSCRTPAAPLPQRAEIARWSLLIAGLWVGRRRRETART